MEEELYCSCLYLDYIGQVILEAEEDMGQAGREVQEGRRQEPHKAVTILKTSSSMTLS